MWCGVVWVFLLYLSNYYSMCAPAYGFDLPLANWPELLWTVPVEKDSRH